MIQRKMLFFPSPQRGVPEVDAHRLNMFTHSWMAPARNPYGHMADMQFVKFCFTRMFFADNELLIPKSDY